MPQSLLASVAVSFMPAVKQEAVLRRCITYTKCADSPCSVRCVVTAKTQYNLKNAREYFEEHLCVGDYYQEGQKVAGEWFGIGAAALGLSGLPVRARVLNTDIEAAVAPLREALRSGSGEPLAGKALGVLGAGGVARAVAAGRALRGAPRARLHVFIATSSLHMQHKLRLSRGEVLARVAEMLNVTPPVALHEFVSQAEAKGQTVVYLVQEQTIVAGFALADVIRPESKPAIQKLHDLGVEVVMLTGDSKAVAQAVAAEAAAPAPPPAPPGSPGPPPRR